MDRFRTCATLSMITALWCWLLCAGYVIWKFGWTDGYLALGEIPFNTSYPVTYATLFIYTFGAFGITFAAAFALTLVSPYRLRIAALCIAWLMGSAVAAVDTSFLFLDHGGGTWLPHEAVRAKFYHPIVTPFWVVVGLTGTASLTRFLRT